MHISDPATVILGVLIIISIITLVLTARAGRSEGLPARPVPKPVLNPQHVKNGTQRDVVNKIQAYLLTNIQARSYDVKRIPQFKGSSNKTLRAPVTAYEKQLVTYVQHQADFLMAKLWSLKDTLTLGQRALIQNIRNTWGGKRYVTIDASANIYGTTSKADDGQLILGLSPKIRLAFALNTMCHELAHMGTANDFEVHGPNHTTSWRWLVQFGLKHLDWPFFEFDWNNACQNFNICNVKDFDSTRVYSLAPMGSNKFKGWGKSEVNHRSNVVADRARDPGYDYSSVDAIDYVKKTTCDQIQAIQNGKTTKNGKEFTWRIDGSRSDKWVMYVHDNPTDGAEDTVSAFSKISSQKSVDIHSALNSGGDAYRYIWHGKLYVVWKPEVWESTCPYYWKATVNTRPVNTRPVNRVPVYKSGGKRQTVVLALWRKLVLSRRRGPPKIAGQLQRAAVLAGKRKQMRLRADSSDPYLQTDFYKAIESMGLPVYEDKFEGGYLSTSWKLATEALGGGTHEKQVFDPKMVTVTTQSQPVAMDIRMETSSYSGYPYISGKAVLNVVAKTGAVKFLAMLPSAPGLMPRLQLFPVVNGKYYALEPKGYPNWPSAGQIGVAETRGDEIDNVHQTLFASSGPGSFKKSVDLVNYTVTSTPDGRTSNFATDIVGYGATFDETGVKFYIKDAFVKEYKWGVDTDINPYTVAGFQGFSPVISLAIGGDTMKGDPMKGIPDNSNPKLSTVPHMLVQTVQLWDSSKPADPAAEICALVSQLTPSASTQSSGVQDLLALLRFQCSLPGGMSGGGGGGSVSISGDFDKLTNMMTLFYTSNFKDMSTVAKDWDIAEEWASGGNREKQAYIPGQVSVSGGALVLTAEVAPDPNMYDVLYDTTGNKTIGITHPILVSGKVQLKNGVQFGAVSFEIELDVADRNGAWPAAWMLPQRLGVNPSKKNKQALATDINEVPFGSSLWPGCGEIDVMEAWGNEKGIMVQTLHFGKDKNTDWKYLTSTRQINPHIGKHTYSAAWSNDGIAFFVDGSLTTYIPWAVKENLGGADPPFTADQFKNWCPILNLAAGGDFFGAYGSIYQEPDTSTWIGNPAKMKIYSVKMWKLTGTQTIQSMVTGMKSNLLSNTYGHAKGADDWEPEITI